MLSHHEMELPSRVVELPFLDAERSPRSFAAGFSPGRLPLVMRSASHHDAEIPKQCGEVPHHGPADSFHDAAPWPRAWRERNAGFYAKNSIGEGTVSS